MSIEHKCALRVSHIVVFTRPPSLQNIAIATLFARVLIQRLVSQTVPDCTEEKRFIIVMKTVIDVGNEQQLTRHEWNRAYALASGFLERRHRGQVVINQHGDGFTIFGTVKREVSHANVVVQYPLLAIEIMRT